MNREVNICSICKMGYEGYGNNAYPVNDGRCCDDCNAFVVIPARLNSMSSRKAENDKEKDT